MNAEYRLFEDFSLVTGVAVTVMDLAGNQLFSSSLMGKTAPLLALLDTLLQNRDQRKVSMIYGCYQSFRFGGRYIFFCPQGLVYFASPLILDHQMYACAVGGPLLMVGREEYLELDILQKYRVAPMDAHALHSLLERVPCLDPKQVQAMAEQLFVNTSFVNGQRYTGLDSAQENNRLQSHISEYIKQVKREADSSFYPLEKEHALMRAMSRGDVPKAKGLLNEILGHILFQSGGELDVMRSRVVELIVLLSRAAVQGGGDVQAIFGLNYSYMQEIDTFSTTEDIIYWLNGIMHRFTEYVFDYATSKHGDVMYRAMDYINHNYMKKLTLEEVAGQVYLSPSYLSKVFKETTGHGFNSYLNRIRIEQSKNLLRDPTINLVDISNLVGYEDQSYFTKVFKKMQGISPGKYRQMVLQSTKL